MGGKYTRYSFFLGPNLYRTFLKNTWTIENLAPQKLSKLRFTLPKIGQNENCTTLGRLKSIQTEILDHKRQNWQFCLFQERVFRFGALYVLIEKLCSVLPPSDTQCGK